MAERTAATRRYVMCRFLPPPASSCSSHSTTNGQQQQEEAKIKEPKTFVILPQIMAVGPYTQDQAADIVGIWKTALPTKPRMMSMGFWLAVWTRKPVLLAD